MNKRRGGLGSGLDALLPSAAPSSGTLEVAISTIQQNPRQPRTLFDDSALEELAASIREHGIIQPLIVSERGADRYELVAGERRWRAAQRAGQGRALLKLKEAEQQQQALAMMLTDDWTVREAERFGDLVKELGDLDAALAAIRAQRMGRSESNKQTKRAAAPPVPARANATTAEDQDIKRQMERILGTPVSLARTEKDLRVTIVFHTNEKLQEFFDLLNAT